jgi:nucleotide-binding universal stress UspA family protein
VLALDGSEGSRRAIPIARELAKRNEARIVVAHVTERVPQPGMTSRGADVGDELEKLAQELSAERIDTEVKGASIGFGGPAVPIAEIANQEDADLIVVGTRGHGAVTGVLVGSVTQRLLHIAHRPVLARAGR